MESRRTDFVKHECSTLWHWNDVPQLQILHRKVYNSGVLLCEVAIVDEALDMENQVLWQLGNTILTPTQFDVIVHPFPVKLLQQLIDGDL